MDHPLQDQYDAIWADALAAFAQGGLSLDPQLPGKASDRRRSATLLIRPAPAVAENVAQVLAEIKSQEPDQYYYRVDELHVTVLSLWTGAEDPDSYFAQMPVYRQAIDAALAQAAPFSIHFTGLTASPAAVLVQGFPKTTALNDLRDRLRSAIGAAGLGGALDGRYRISAAHMTAVRFCRPLQDLSRLARTLASLRRRDFGGMEATEIQLVENDWYMSHDRVRVLRTYPLVVQ